MELHDQKDKMTTVGSNPYLCSTTLLCWFLLGVVLGTNLHKSLLQILKQIKEMKLRAEFAQRLCIYIRFTENKYSAEREARRVKKNGP